MISFPDYVSNHQIFNTRQNFSKTRERSISTLIEFWLFQNTGHYHVKYGMSSKNQAQFFSFQSMWLDIFRREREIEIGIYIYYRLNENRMSEVNSIHEKVI